MPNRSKKKGGSKGNTAKKKRKATKSSGKISSEPTQGSSMEEFNDESINQTESKLDDKTSDSESIADRNHSQSEEEYSSEDESKGVESEKIKIEDNIDVEKETEEIASNVGEEISDNFNGGEISEERKASIDSCKISNGAAEEKVQIKQPEETTSDIREEIYSTSKDDEIKDDEINFREEIDSTSKDDEIKDDEINNVSKLTLNGEAGASNNKKEQIKQPVETTSDICEEINGVAKDEEINKDSKTTVNGEDDASKDEKEKDVGTNVPESSGKVFGAKRSAETAGHSFGLKEKIDSDSAEKKMKTVDEHPLQDQPEANKITTRSSYAAVTAATSASGHGINTGYVHTFNNTEAQTGSKLTLKQFIKFSRDDRKDQTVFLNFNIAVPKNLLSDDDMVVVLCGHPSLGKWETPLLEVLPKEDFKSFKLYSGKVKVPECLVKMSIPYKYCVFNSKGLKFWEILYNKNDFDNRVLNYSPMIDDMEPYQFIFDDILLPKKDGQASYLAKFKNWIGVGDKKKDVFEHLPEIFEYFLKKVLKLPSKRIAYGIMGLYQSFFEAKIQYLYRPREWKKVDKEVFESFLELIEEHLTVQHSVISNIDQFGKDNCLTKYTEVLWLVCGLATCGCEIKILARSICLVLSLEPFNFKDTSVDIFGTILKENDFHLIQHGLDLLWSVVKTCDHVGEMWVHLVPLIHLLDQNDGLTHYTSAEEAKFYGGLVKSNRQAAVKNISKIHGSLRMDYSLRRFVASIIESNQFADMMERQYFENEIIIEAMTNYLESNKKDTHIPHLCNALTIFVVKNIEKGFSDVREFFGLLRMFQTSLENLKWSTCKEYFLLLIRTCQWYNVGILSKTQYQNYELFINKINGLLERSSEPFFTKEKALQQLPILNALSMWQIDGDEENFAVRDKAVRLLDQFADKMIANSPANFIDIFNDESFMECSVEIVNMFSIKIEKLGSSYEMMRRPAVINKVMLKHSNSSKIFLNILKSFWEQIPPVEKDILHALFGKNILALFIERLGKIEDPDLEVFGRTISSVIIKLMHQVGSNKMKICDTKTIADKRSIFLDYCKAAHKSLNGEQFDFKALSEKIESVESKVNHFLKEISSVKNFIQFLKLQATCDVSAILNICNSVNNDLYLWQCIDCNFFSEHFSLEQEDINTLLKVDNYGLFNAVFFKKLWRKIDSDSGNKENDYAEVLTTLAPTLQQTLCPTLDELKDWTTQWLDENINAAKVKVLLEEESVEDFGEELKCFNNFFQLDYRNTESVIKKVECLRKIEDVGGLAGEILEVSQKLEMNGDFDTITMLYDKRNDFDEFLISEVNDEVMKHSEMLNNITDDQMKYLDIVSKNLNLVTWVRDELKDRNELKKFIDFIQSSCETSFEIQRVKCFELACSSLEKLLFDTDKDSGFEDMIKACSINTITHSSGNDPVKAIIDTNSHLEWFKRSYESLGSVVKKASMKAHDINRCGVYQISLNLEDYLNEENLYESVIKLVLIDETDKEKIMDSLDNGLNFFTKNDNEFNLMDFNAKDCSNELERKIYHSSDIDNLQSLLVLLGDSKMDANRITEREYFIETCRHMKKLARVFVDLIEVGCLQMFDSKFLFKCCIEEVNVRECIVIETIKTIEDLSAQQNEYQSKMEHMRHEEPLLNYFSTKQVVLLQKYTANVLNNKDDKSLAYRATTLLSSIHKDIDETKLKSILEYLFSKKAAGAKKPMNSSKKQFQGFTKSEIEEMLDNLMEKGVAEEIVFASLVAVEPFDESEALAWCFETAQDMDSEEIEQLEEEGRKKLEDLESDEDVQDESTEEQDEEEITFLCIEDLIKYFQEIYKHSGGALKMKTKTWIFEEPRPYLFTVEKDRVIETVLHIYYEQYGELPKFTDVLFCTKKTRVEEIELLIRRAISNPKELYSIMFIEELDFQTIKKAVDFIEQRLEFGMKSPLLLFCSSEKEYDNLFVSSFAAYHSSLPMKIESKFVEKDFQKCLFADGDHKTLPACKIIKESFVCSLVTSTEAGMGKSFKIQQKSEALKQHILRAERLQGDITTKITIPIHGNHVNIDEITNLLLENEEELDHPCPKIIHFDISPTISSGLEQFLFNVVALGAIQNKNDILWKRRNIDEVFCEVTLTEIFCQVHLSKMLSMLPKITCETPADGGLSPRMFQSEEYQRVYQYLSAYDAGKDLNHVTYSPNVFGDLRHCLKTLYKHCGIQNPSWMELNNFVKFFNQQLQNCEESNFCNNNIPVNQEIISGFKSFVVKFSLEMSKDFATRSINSDDEKGGRHDDMIKLKRKWEESNHPYLFFNHDHSSFSFVGFNIDQNGNLLDPREGRLILRNVMSPQLYQGLSIQLRMERDYINFNTRFDLLSKEVKLKILCRVMGVEYFYGIDPDPSFVLTNDNVQKILAIHMRFRASIPVIMSGETGCGKTKLIKYMTGLIASGKKIESIKYMEKFIKSATNQEFNAYISTFFSADEKDIIRRMKTLFVAGKKKELTDDIRRLIEKTKTVQNLVLAKVHGGTTFQQIKDYLEQSIRIAENNMQYTLQFGGIDTVLFFDECNTSEAVGLIKEIMIDSRCFGKSVNFKENRLKIVAAINPYRRHSQHMVEKLKSAGLGYYNENEEELERLGKIPLRQLVYRVHKLPDSLKSIVWDYGQLNEVTEKAYIEKIVSKEQSLAASPQVKKTLIELLSFSQQYMRKQKDECSFVSLRDVERALQVFNWFRSKKCMFGDFHLKSTDEISELHILLTLSVCYISRLEDRTKYIDNLRGFTKKGLSIVERIQKNVARQMVLEKNIALNKALCENIFMMLVCIELRIPLFVVGKPGSSKSLAKTIIQESMQGKLSKSKFCHSFKQISMASYQCSAMSTAEGIISTFKQCSEYQEGKNLDEFASVVVLDEVGLAEDSPRMPLKALHPLLEDGTDCSEDLALDERRKNVMRPAFIGLSNFAIDPAKMNRGIMLSHPIPDLKQLFETAKELCKSDDMFMGKMDDLLKILAKGYLMVYKEQKENVQLKKCKKLEFFGLRDYYSLVKEIHCMGKQNFDISPRDIKIAVQRNFSGLEDFDSWAIFQKGFDVQSEEWEELKDIEVEPIDLIEHSLRRRCPCFEGAEDDERQGHNKCYNSRYLLLMTEEFAALDVVKSVLLKKDKNVDIIFGSSFPKDQEFQQVYKDITHIKMCMETGRTVVLLNMENLYESLYDALNQYYVYFGGQKYVDLGLGVHRVKCRVHDNFKLIVIADVNTVYSVFPIPLINRLEKHFVLPSLNMSQDQKEVSEELQSWANKFANCRNDMSSRIINASQAFPGFNDNTSQAIVTKLWDNNLEPEQVLDAAKCHLIQAATPDAIIRYSEHSKRKAGSDIFHMYLNDSRHFSLVGYVDSLLATEETFSQITTFSRLLADVDIQDERIHLLHLKEFQTEDAFKQKLKSIVETSNDSCSSGSCVVIQCTNVAKQQNLINCAKHICVKFYEDERLKLNYPLFFVFVLQLHHTDSGLESWQSNWTIFHIDELKRTESAIMKFYDKKLSEMFDNQISNWEDILQLTQSCIQSSIKDLNDEKKMDTETIKIKIKNLIDVLNVSKAGDCKFAEKLFAFIKEGLVDKEKLEYCDGEKKICANWVKKQANNQCEKANYSTFNKSLIHTIEESVKPLLTKFLMMCDVNNNLLSMNHSSEKWWSLFDQEIYKVVDQQENCVSFKCLFPFSSHLVSLVDKVAEVFSFEETINEKVERLVNALNEQLHHLDLSQEEERNFVHDFLCLKLQCFDESIVNILRKALHHQVENVLQNINHQSFVNMNLFISCVKLIYDQYETRFKLAVKLANLKKLDISKINVCYDKREFTVDLMMLETFFESIWPDQRFMLLKGKKGIQWMACMKKVKPLMKQMSECYSKQTNAQFGELSSVLYEQQKLNWTKLQIFLLFIESVVKDFNSFDKPYVVDFFKVLNELEDNMEGQESWKLIHNAILHCIEVRERNGEFQRLVTSFYIELVTQFCFNREDGSKVDEEVIRMMMEHVFSDNKKSTKIFSPMQDYKIDESYTVRSFLLKQLLKMKRNGQLNQLLEYNLKMVSADTDSLEDFWSISNLFVYLCEDFELNRVSVRDDATQPTHVAKLLEKAMANIKDSDKVDAKSLKSLAEARCALTFGCDYLHKIFIIHESEEDLDIPAETLFNLVKSVCVENEAHYFCLRHIIKRYGTQELDKIVEKSGFSWLKLKTNEEETSKQDLFLVYGEDYKLIREGIQDAMVEGNTLSEFKKSGDYNQELLNICVLRELLMGATDNELKIKFCDDIQLKQYSSEVLQVINNSDEAMVELLLHLHVLMIAQNNATDIIRLFSRSAHHARHFFLPAMPSDHFEEIRNARPAQGNWVMYECPNGHPYVITNCGQPNQSYNCNVCNARIGSHVEGSGQLSSNNRTVQARDLTKSGYCVGLPNDRSLDGTTERALRSLSVALERFIIHLSLYRLSIVNPQAAIQCITLPEQGVQDARKFFYKHLQMDIRLLSQKLSKNSNDVMILFHLFLKHLNTSTWTYQGDLTQQLASKDGRVLFENDFDRHVVSPFLQTFENDLVEAQRAILNDMDKSRDPKFRKLHHLNIPKCPEIEGVELLNNWKLWQNHRTVSYSHFCNFTEQHLDRSVENGDQLKVLQQFLQQEKQFELVKNLPLLVKFQKLLYSKFNYKFSKESASKIKARDAEKRFLENKKEFQKLLSCFCKTWNACYQHIVNYRRFPGDKDSLPRILQSSSSLEYFICSTSGNGVCAMLLIDYLAFLQHDFLDTWKSRDVLKLNMFNRVNVMSITESDVVNYSREKDLLPLLYSHCNYAVEIGRGMKIEYDLQQIEKKLMEKIFFGTSLIDIVIERFVYLDDIRTSEKFNRFSKAISQEKISPQDSKQVCYELSDMTDLTNSLNAVEIAIGFLSVTHGEGDMKLRNYVENILQMNIDLYLKSPRLQSFQLKHLKSVWLTLTIESGMRLHEAHKVAFDLNATFHVTMDKKLKNIVKENLQHHLVRPLMELLTEYIIFKLNVPEYADFELFEALQDYEDKEKEEHIIADEWLDVPVLLKHSYDMWKLLADFRKK